MKFLRTIYDVFIEARRDQALYTAAYRLKREYPGKTVEDIKRLLETGDIGKLRS